MSALPPGWVAAQLDELAEVRLGRQRSPKNHTGDRMRPYLRAANVTWSGLDLSDVKEMQFTTAESEVYELEPGDVLVAEASGSESEVGKAALWRGQIDQCCFQNTLLRVRTRGPLSEYLFQFLRAEAVNGSLGRAARGVGIHHIGAHRLAVWQVPLPPLAEQRRIVAVIEELLSRVDASHGSLTHALSSLEALRSELLMRALAAWPERQLGEFSNVYVGATPSRRSSELWDGGVPWVSSGEVAFCRIRETRETISPAAVTSPDRLHPPGTVLLAMIGEGKTRGQAAILEIAAAHNQNSAAIRLDSGQCLPEWLYYVFVARYDQTRAAGAGGQQPALNRARVSGIGVPLPPLQAQRRIVAELERQLSIIDAMQAAITNAKGRSEQLRRSILELAFSGKLVPQDPDDEPASVLLERIRAERAAAAPVRGRRARAGG